MDLHLVLLEPEIPQNTGNIARTCAATGTSLHLIEPLGFSVDEKHVRRAGLDYWDLVDVHVYKSLAQYQEENAHRPLVLATKKTGAAYTNFGFPEICAVVLGKETAGLPERLLVEMPEACVRIPMVSQARSLNLSNAAALLVYEALRQHDFDGLDREGPGLGSR